MTLTSNPDAPPQPGLLISASGRQDSSVESAAQLVAVILLLIAWVITVWVAASGLIVADRSVPVPAPVLHRVEVGPAPSLSA